MDVWIIKEIILDRQYEQVRKLQKGDIVVDIGAGFGDFSILASKTAKIVYAFDMDAKRLRLMKKNLKINQCNNVITIHKKVASLDNLFKQNNIYHCHSLKIDCEGSEYDILHYSSSKTLSKIDYIAAEIHLFTPEMKKRFRLLKEKLLKNKFKIKQINNPVHDSLKLLFAYRNKS